MRRTFRPANLTENMRTPARLAPFLVTQMRYKHETLDRAVSTFTLSDRVRRLIWLRDYCEPRSRMHNGRLTTIKGETLLLAKLIRPTPFFRRVDAFFMKNMDLVVP